MNPKAANTARSGARPISQKDRDNAKRHLVAADKFLKEGNFERARDEVASAQKSDPSNPYAYAFLDRITHFEGEIVPIRAADAQREADEAKRVAEEEREKEEEEKQEALIYAQKAAVQANQEAAEAARRKKEAIQRIAEARLKREDQNQIPAPVRPQPPPPTPPAKQEPPREQPKPPPPKPKPDSMIEAARPVIVDMLVSRAKPDSMIDATRPVIADVLASRAKSETQKTSPPSITDVLEQVSQASHHSPGSPKRAPDVNLDQMRRQIEMLTNALDQEKKVRQEMNQQQLKGAISQLRSAIEKAWVNGVPKDNELIVLHEMAVKLGIPDDVERTLNREVKLDMYGRAVKEVVAKQKLLRSSSRTLEWLRDVYKVTIDEYLEYESKFLMDLVAVQYKGTILLVTGNDKIARDLGMKLKSGGYAVVNATTPENALEKIEKISPHYILCDFEFSAGSLSGVKFLHVLRANSKFNHVPYILMCAASEMPPLQSSELRPTEGYIEKPVDMDNLNAIMNEKLIAFREYLSSL
jgi:CheY-like chemotaxis protein